MGLRVPAGHSGAAPPLARAHNDRDALARERPDTLADARAHPDVRAVVVCGGHLHVSGTELVLSHLNDLPEPSVIAYLGRDLAPSPVLPPLAPTPPVQLTASILPPPATAPVLPSAADPLTPTDHRPPLTDHTTTTDPALLAAGASVVTAAPPAGPPILLWVVADSDADRIATDPASWAPLRDLAAHCTDRDAGLATEAMALANWHAVACFCGHCGAPTQAVQAGWARACEADGRLHFPRTDPAVIVRITDDDDRLLVGANALWQPQRFSLLAGFVEPGESLERAVVREIAEEANLPVDRPRFIASQPWPMPLSLMLGFAARVAVGVSPDVARPDGTEIVALRWLRREDVPDFAALLPGPASIARWLIEDWYGGPLPQTP